MSDPTVEILLATYNGEKYLAGLLDSLLAQTYRRFRLVVRDDGSTDNTTNLLKGYENRFEELILIPSGGGDVRGPIHNFSRLLEHSTADYVFLCDQDDVWEPVKVEKLLALIQSKEAETGKQTPLLVHCDMTVTDAELAPISNSFWDYIGIDADRKGFNHLLIQNIVTGCASIMNRALIDKSVPIPAEAMMHDWWLGLVAACFGMIQEVEDPLVKYRQHSMNTLGAKRYSTDLDYLINRARQIFDPKSGYVLSGNIEQAQAFLKRFSPEMPAESRKLLTGLVSLQSMGGIRRRLFMLENGLFRAKLMQNIGLFLRV